jgi:tRNA G18 (ribose-2'-O)-methylase SpoU
MSSRRIPISVVLEDIRSVYNIGAIFRTSDAILAEKIHLCGITAHPPRRDLEKTALGVTKSVPWEYSRSAHETLLKLKKKGCKIYALELGAGSVDFKAAKYEFPMALVLGNEVDGVSPESLELADLTVSIPMLGGKESLNVAVAYGIVAYEALYKVPDVDRI